MVPSKVKSPFVVLLLLLSIQLSSQNLVLNPSFESFSACPLGTSEFSNATDWDNPFVNSIADTCSTSDLFNSCNFLGAFGVGVPANLLGNEPARTGNGYAGIILSEQISLFNCVTFGGSNWREYVQGRLSTPLLAGQTYCVTFYVSLADNVKFATDQFSVFFSNNALSVSCAAVGNGPLPVVPQLSWTGGMVTQVNGWTEMQWSYTATGGEQFITVGNFRDDASTSTSCVNSGAFNPYAYYYIDDVSVVPGGCSVLPVDLAFFNGEMVDGNVVLRWESRTESQNELFYLERSKKGKTWQSLVEVPAVPNAGRGAEYGWTDLNSYSNAYYRLLQKDLNGDQRILETIWVASETLEEPKLRVLSGNPVQGYFDFQLSGINSPTLFQIVDIRGQTIFSKTIPTESTRQHSISLQNIPQGMYKALWKGADFRENKTILVIQ